MKKSLFILASICAAIEAGLFFSKPSPLLAGLLVFTFLLAVNAAIVDAKIE